MNTDLPPSSRNTRFSVSAPLAMIFLPTAVEPVNDTRSTRGSLVNISPAVTGSELVTMLSTPLGRPASIASSPKIAPIAGVSGAGLSPTVQPARRAATTLPTLMYSDTFHGVIAPTTPSARKRDGEGEGWSEGVKH